MAEKKRLAWFILARVLVVSLFLAVTLFLATDEPVALGRQARFGFTTLIVATYLFSIASLLAFRLSDRHVRSLTYLQIVWDVLFVTVLLLMTGGINSPFSFIYLLAIINASVLLTRRDALYTASLCAILYGAMVDLIYYGYMTPLKEYYAPPVQYDSNYIFYITFYNFVAFYLVAFLTGSLAERVRKSETALKDKVIDYEELEQIHGAIVSNLTSGLLTINREGRIRVFNRYAEELTGMSQSEAYDRPLHEVIPGFAPLIAGGEGVSRDEIQFRTLFGGSLTLSVSMAPLTDKYGEFTGLIVNFQDVTQLKKMEEELKRADRLAAVGELSAAIAHEIRNPLASISGSVQLIADGGNIALSDRKLLEIVMRETDRLNGLIREFLAYARPVRPEKTLVRAETLFSEVRAMLSSDARFAGVRIDCAMPGELRLSVDPDQFKQVLWNILVNATDAMGGEGRISISAAPYREGGGKVHGDWVKLVIADTGCGMDEEQLRRLFEPFYTTKFEGTGLGLATVYRIIEAHGGRVEVTSAKGSGTVFTILLPA